MRPLLNLTYLEYITFALKESGDDLVLTLFVLFAFSIPNEYWIPSYKNEPIDLHCELVDCLFSIWLNSVFILDIEMQRETPYQ